MKRRYPIEKRKSDCPNCGEPIEKEFIGKHSYCRNCRSDYMKAYRQKQKNELEMLREFYSQHASYG